MSIAEELVNELLKNKPLVPEVQPPKPPTTGEMLKGEPLVADGQPPKTPSMFEVVLDGDITPLLRAIRHNPEEFTPDSVHLITELAIGLKTLPELSTHDLRVLDNVTVQYATTNWQRKKEAPKSRKPVVRKTVLDQPAKLEQQAEQEMSPFWWL